MHTAGASGRAQRSGTRRKSGLASQTAHWPCHRLPSVFALSIPGPHRTLESFSLDRESAGRLKQIGISHVRVSGYRCGDATTAAVVGAVCVRQSPQMPCSRGGSREDHSAQGEE